MTEETTPEQEIFKSLNISKILVAAIEALGEIRIPAELFINAGNEDRDLKVDYNSDDKTFSFKLRGKDESEFNNDELITDFE